MSGTLYIVATPIGNPDDITIRALRILRRVDVVAAEDTRKTGRLLAHHQIKTKMLSYHEHNESRRTPGMIKRLQAGEKMALVSDAGTPVVSDPGYRLLLAAIAEQIEVIPIPGVSAVIASLSVAGLPSDGFIFIGFLPKKKGRRKTQIEALSAMEQTIILYESPRRILSLVGELMACFGDRRGMLAREMTKPFEEFIRGRLSEIQTQLQQKDQIRGECTLLIEGRGEQTGATLDNVRQEIENEMMKPDAYPSDLAKKIAKKYNLNRKEIYAEIVRLREEKTSAAE